MDAESRGAREGACGRARRRGRWKRLEPAWKGLKGVESYEEAAWSRAGIGALCGRGSRWEWSERRGFKGKSPLGTGKSPNSSAGVRADEQKT